MNNKIQEKENNALNLLVPYACRSDEALTTPIIKAFEKKKWASVFPFQLPSANYNESYEKTISFLNCFRDIPDLIIICGDRVEMAACAAACFHSKVPIAHYGAGIIGDFATFDSVNRHVISLYSDIFLCENYEEMEVVTTLLFKIGRVHAFHNCLGVCDVREYFRSVNVYEVGSLYWEGLENVDESLVPNEPYDLVLINPETLRDTKLDLPFQEGRLVIRIGENPDGKVYGLWKDSNKNFGFKDYDTLPRPQFLGLLKNCERYITNSSSAYYEAPYFLDKEQIILVGKRNSTRSTRFKKQDFKSSDKIVEVIEEWWRIKGYRRRWFKENADIR